MQALRNAADKGHRAEVEAFPKGECICCSGGVSLLGLSEDGPGSGHGPKAEGKGVGTSMIRRNIFGGW